MKYDLQHETEIRQYLLGELPLDERVLVEQRLFLDSNYAELHQAVEGDLIDEYLADELAGNEREKFESHFLDLPEHRADLKIAQALQKYLAAEPGPSSETGANNPRDSFTLLSFLNKPMVWLSVTFAALILLTLLGWLAFRFTRQPANNAPQQAREPQSTTPRPDEQRVPAPSPLNENRVETADRGNTNGAGGKPKSSEKPPDRRSASLHAVVSALLLPGGTARDPGSIRTLTLYAETKQISLTLPLVFNESYEKYRAELLQGERRIEEMTNLRSQPDEKYRAIVAVSFSAERLREQSYRIKLHAVPTDQQPAEIPIIYPFTVERK